jgi:cyclophilin family peptidyl-prolyl cis-trans isomerase
MTRSPRLPAHATVAALVALALVVAACAGGSTAAPIQPPGGATTEPTATPVATPAEWMPDGCPGSAPPPMAAGAKATVTLATAKGDIVIEVDGSLGPLAAANFVALAECGAYDGVVFHRLVPGFVIQGGDVQYGREPNVDTAAVGAGDPGYAFADDPVSVGYLRGIVAMANSGANTNGSQFFICLADVGLPPDYSVFGTVTTGMDVVDAIAAMPNSGEPDNQALEPVAVSKATVTRP